MRRRLVQFGLWVEQMTMKRHDRQQLSHLSEHTWSDWSHHLHELKHGGSFISASSSFSSSTHLWDAAGTSCPGLTGDISLKFHTSCCWRRQRRRPHLLKHSNTCRTDTEITAAYEAFQNRKWRTAAFTHRLYYFTFISSASVKCDDVSVMQTWASFCFNKVTKVIFETLTALLLRPRMMMRFLSAEEIRLWSWRL